jgi:hypothetical protein
MFEGDESKETQGWLRIDCVVKSHWKWRGILTPDRIGRVRVSN